tara:strand:- start:251 stop:943 length:693 start_codon:yes stop_codon:yes gene_type:complete
VKLGIVAGGFKPLTSGHFGKIALSTIECDKTLLLYSEAGRSSAGGVEITSDQIKKMWTILKPMLTETFGDKLIVKDASPWPVSAVYGIIKCTTRCETHVIKSERLRARKFLKNFGIDSTPSHITVYGSQEDLQDRFISFVEKGLSRKMFDMTYDDGKLSFSSGDGKIINSVKSFYQDVPTNKIIKAVSVRGTEVREMMMTKDPDVSLVLPPIFRDQDTINEFIDIFRRSA